MSPANQFIACIFLFALIFIPTGGCGESNDTESASDHRSEESKIRQLITSVESLDGAVFVRNGTEYTAAAAADHLRLKWKNSGGRIETAEHFIEYLATRSSITGREYSIRLPDGRVVKSADYLRQILAEMKS